MPKYRVYATEIRFYHMEVTAKNTLEALLSAKRNQLTLSTTEDVSMRQFTPDEAELIPEDKHD